MKKYAIYLPDILIENADDIVYMFNFRNISIFTCSIYDNDNKVHDDDISKILKNIEMGMLKGIIIFDINYIPKINIKKIQEYCHKYKCKLYFLNNNMSN